MNIIGYFKHYGYKWLLTEKSDGQVIGIDISPKGKIHTLHIAESEVTELTMISN